MAGKTTYVGDKVTAVNRLRYDANNTRALSVYGRSGERSMYAFTD